MESLIAMVILVVCFGVGTMIYSNVLDSDMQRLKLKGILILNNEAVEIKQSQNYIDGEKMVGDHLLSFTFEKQEGAEHLYKFILELKNKEGKLISTRKEMIIAP